MELYKYRIWCNDESIYKYVWDEEEPIICPSNDTHTIDISSITIIDELTDTTVTIKEESVHTGGHFQASTIRVDALANQTTSKSISWEIPISALSVEFVTEENHRGDVFDMSVAKNTTVGIITSDIIARSSWQDQNYTLGNEVFFEQKNYVCILDTVSNEDPTNAMHWSKIHNVINVSQSVIDNVSLGYYVTIGSDSLGYITNIDSENSQITTQYASENPYLASSPSYIQITIYIVHQNEIMTPWQHIIGESKIGGSHIPANTEITVDYHNKSNVDKILVGKVEYLY